MTTGVPEVELTWLGLWLVVGAVVAWLLVRGDMPWAWAVLALVGWPALLPLLRAPEPREERAGGPLGEEIRRTFAALAQAQADPAATHLDCDDALGALQSALLRVDARLAVVDDILADGGPELGPLKEARERALAEVRAVLGGVSALRVQVGLLTLAGDRTPVREQLAELQGRVAALEEVG